MNKAQLFKIIETIVIALLTCCAIALGMTSCKAWRTISTTSTYTQVGDSSKVTTTISSKTVEEYTGVKFHIGFLLLFSSKATRWCLHQMVDKHTNICLKTCFQAEIVGWLDTGR